MVVICRPANGASLDKMEYLLDNDGNLLKFETRNEALLYLLKHEDYTLNSIENEHIQFIYTNESCQCKCRECERSDYCVFRDKFCRKTHRLGDHIYSECRVGLCPKLSAEWRKQFTKYV